MESVTFFVAGRPAPQGSKRHVGGGRLVESSKAVGPWRDAVRTEGQHLDLPSLAGPVAVVLVFTLPRPAAHWRTGKHEGELRATAPRFPAKRPDLDKLVRATLDGLTSAGLYHDDSQVVDLVAAKRYPHYPDAPRVGCHVTVTTVGGLR